METLIHWKHFTVRFILATLVDELHLYSIHSSLLMLISTFTYTLLKSC